MKTMVLHCIYGERAATVHNLVCFNVHTTAEYLNKNFSIGQLLQHISKSIVVCVWPAGTKMLSWEKKSNDQRFLFLTLSIFLPVLYTLKLLAPTSRLFSSSLFM